jgi:hypothetical protein
MALKEAFTAVLICDAGRGVYRLAIDLAREIGDQAREAETLEKLGNTVLLTGRSPQSTVLLEERDKQVILTMIDDSHTALTLHGHAPGCRSPRAPTTIQLKSARETSQTQRRGAIAHAPR